MGVASNPNESLVLMLLLSDLLRKLLQPMET
jgi:hypothetical protein